MHGADEKMLARARRALNEVRVEGLATVIPFHRAVDPAFIGDANGFSVHTRWIETGVNNTIEPLTDGEPLDDARPPRQKVVVEIDGRRVEVSLPADSRCPMAAAARSVSSGASPPRKAGCAHRAAASGDAVPRLCRAP